MKAGWVTKTLGDFCERVTVGHVGITSPYYREEGVLFLRTQNVGITGLVLDDLKYVTPDFHASQKKSSVKTGDVLLSRVITHTVHCAVVPPGLGEANCANVILVRPAKELSSEFLAYYIRSSDAQKHLLDRKTGSAQLVVNTKVVQSWPISVPRLPEQHRIVAILDETFDGIATARANAEKNLQNARALFESHLQSVFTERGEGWVDTTLGAEIDLLVGFAFKSAQYSTGADDIRLLRGDNIVQGSLRWEDVKKWPKDDTATYDRYWLREGDVVLAMDRPWVKAGLKHATIAADDLPCLLVQRTACLRCKAKLDSRFMIYLVRSTAFIQHILGVQTGLGVPHISGQQIKGFEFARPLLVDQKVIAAKLDSLLDETQRLESLYQRKLAALDELKKSLLHQAFSGAL